MILRFKKQKKASSKTVSDYKMEMVLKQGREQIQKLIEKGIKVPVVLL